MPSSAALPLSISSSFPSSLFRCRYPCSLAAFYIPRSHRLCVHLASSFHTQSNVAVVQGLRQKLQQSQELMREMNRSWEEKLRLAERMREEHAKRQEALGVVDQVGAAKSHVSFCRMTVDFPGSTPFPPPLISQGLSQD